jgi:hypothetical protein
MRLAGVNMNQVLIKLSGLNRLDQLELTKTIDPEDISFNEERAPRRAFGDPATISAIVVLGLATLKVLSAYLAKSRSTQRVTVDFEIRDQSGNVKRATITEIASSSSADPEVIARLSELMKTDTILPKGEGE